MNEYIALLRGINVGGNNIIRMADLKAGFKSMGFQNVRTYIQSGNVIFSSEMNDKEALTEKIEAGLSKLFNYTSRIVLISKKELKTIVEGAPPEFGQAPDLYRYDVLFLKPPLTVDEAFGQLPAREGVDRIFKGDAVIYYTRLISQATKSRLNKVVGMPVYKEMTIRNWNTTLRLLSL